MRLRMIKCSNLDWSTERFFLKYFFFLSLENPIKCEMPNSDIKMVKEQVASWKLANASKGKRLIARIWISIYKKQKTIIWLKAWNMRKMDFDCLPRVERVVPRSLETWVRESRIWGSRTWSCVWHIRPLWSNVDNNFEE